MINNDFEKAMEFVLKWEGGYSNDPNDPGGETKYGISKRSYPNEDIKNMTLERAKEIYYQNYWLKSDCDKFSYPMNIIIFDTAVNMGRKRAFEFLRNTNDWRDYLLLRLYTYSKFKLAKLYFRGWANRVLDLYHLIKEKDKLSFPKD